VLAAEAVGATVRWVDFDPGTSELDAAQVAAAVGERTKLVAFTAASNLVGTMPDVRAIADFAHAAGAQTYVDGVHLVPHAPVDVTALGADFLACSPYKFLGPHCGVLAARPETLEPLRPDKLMPSSNDVPERFELGTLPYELMAGTTAAVDFLAGLASDELPPGASRRDRLVASLTALEAHEDALRERIEAGLADLSGVTLWSRARRRTPTLLATFEHHDVHEVRRHLAVRNVNAPAGSFYAYEASRRLGLGAAGGLRIGLAPYNDDADVDRLLEALGEVLGRRPAG
jgi:cysteine desulfurase family protein (TIGR01976 family)